MTQSQIEAIEKHIPTNANVSINTKSGKITISKGSENVKGCLFID
jgi:hypothetical protein